METISWADRVINEVRSRVEEATHFPHTIKRKKPDWIGHILRMNCLQKHVIEEMTGQIEGKIRRRKRNKPLDGLKENKMYWSLRQEALVRTLCRTHFARGNGPVLRQIVQ